MSNVDHMTASHLSSRFAVETVPEPMVTAMLGVLSAQTKECISETFGISANTWLKIKQGAPVRRSVFERLVTRLEHKGVSGSATRSRQ